MHDRGIVTKIRAGQKYKVFKSMFNGRCFYKLRVSQTNFDGSKDKYYVSVYFKKNIELANETEIIIHTAYQNFRKNPNDPYNYIDSYVITEFEEVKDQQLIETEALDKFRDTLCDVESGNCDYIDYVGF